MSTVVHVQQSNISPHSRTAALLLCIFLGGFGAHHFYVGKSGTGFLILILTFCTGMGAIWAFIDMIIILAGSFTDNMGRIVSSWSGGSQPTTPYVVTAQPLHQQPVQPQYQPQPSPPPQQPVQPLTQTLKDEAFCAHCGAMIKSYEKFCRSCGETIQQKT